MGESKEMLEAREVEGWIKSEQERLARGNEVEFNGIKVAVEDGILYFKDKKTEQFSLLPKKEGLMLDSSWTLAAEKNGNGIRAYLFSKKSENVFIFELEGKEGGMEVRKTEVELPFPVGEGLIDFREGTIIAANAEEYCLCSRKVFRAKHNAGEVIGIISIGNGKGAFAGKEELHLVKGGSRSAIQFEKRAESVRFGIGKKNYEWLIVRSREWKSRFLAVVLEGDEEFCYAFSSFR
ncbi:MAG: hypothetical protein QW035_04345 [Candidatus Anstonellales archaeon]